MEKRTLLAVVLSILIIVVFQYSIAKRYPQQPVAKTIETRVTEPQKLEEAAPITKEFIPQDEEEYAIETDKFILTFSNIGGSVKSVGLKEFSDTENAEPFKLLDIKTPRYYVGAINLPTIEIWDSAIYKMARYGNKISYLYKADEIEIEKIYTIHNNKDYIELQTILKNLSQKTIRLNPRISAGSDINASDPMAHRYVYVSAKVDGRIFSDKKDSSRIGDVSWVALNSKYFCILLRPYQLGRKVLVNLLENKSLAATLESALLVLEPGSRAVEQYLFYIGPLDITRLRLLDMGLEEVVNYGVFNGISKVLLSTLRFFHKVVRNWGLAIIFLTLLVNVILYPLTRKSYKSMKAMQELQPHMDKLRTAHKDNPHKLNKELMELYRKYNVNPLGGCLPLLLQMPIFIALYHSLIRSVELKGANFLWIKDLSKPDAVKLPFSIPILGDSINILPVLMMIAMIIQQKISAPPRSSEMTEQQKQQQNMMLMMPIIFVIIFYTLPSGLVLYWLVNTILMIINQHRIKRAPVVAIEK